MYMRFSVPPLDRCLHSVHSREELQPRRGSNSLHMALPKAIRRNNNWVVVVQQDMQYTHVVYINWTHDIPSKQIDETRAASIRRLQPSHMLAFHARLRYTVEGAEEHGDLGEAGQQTALAAYGHLPRHQTHPWFSLSLMFFVHPTNSSDLSSTCSHH